MSNYNYMLGANYGTRFHAPQDDCWDRLCPLNVKASNPAQEKLACLKSNMSQVCDCCKKGGMADCEILIPGQGLVDPCKMLGRGSGGAKDHFCDCVKEVCPTCRSRDEFLKNQEAVVNCCQSKCTGGSCDYDCSQIALSYLSPNSLMGSCLPDEKPPTPPAPPPITTTENKPSFFDKNKTWVFIIVGLILAIILVLIIGFYLKGKKGKKSRK